MPTPDLTVSLLHKGWKWNVHQWSHCKMMDPQQETWSQHFQCSQNWESYTIAIAQQLKATIAQSSLTRGGFLYWNLLRLGNHSCCHTHRALSGWTRFTTTLCAPCWPPLKEHAQKGSRQIYAKPRIWRRVRLAAKQASQQKALKKKENLIPHHQLVWSHSWACFKEAGLGIWDDELLSASVIPWESQYSHNIHRDQQVRR